MRDPLGMKNFNFFVLEDFETWNQEKFLKQKLNNNQSQKIEKANFFYLMIF